MTGPSDTSRGGAGRRRGLEAFAAAWAKALHRAHYVPIGADEREQIVSVLAGRLVAGLLADPADPALGHQIGVDLVAAGFGAPEALGRTVAIIDSRLLADASLPPSPATRARLTELLGAIATGFASAAHDRSLRDQDSVRLAALTAHLQAEEELRIKEARFRHFATHDPLTGLANLTLFTERLGRLFTTAQATDRVGVCCLDIDNFAAVNDVLGHQVGDQLLSEIAGRLKAIVTRPDDLVARLDSDRFAFLISHTTCAEDAVKIADLAQSTLDVPFYLAGTEVPVTASMGVAEGPVAAGRTATALIRSSEIALHWAKADGKAGTRLFDPDRSEADSARYRLSAALPAAIRRQEFTLVYQPVVDLQSGRLTGVEALARWRHPGLGLLGAERFIEIAERTGAIVGLGQQVLEQACRQAALWQQARPGLYVNVNVAVQQLQHPGLVGSVSQILDRTGLSADLLQLEITEQAVIDLTSDVVHTLSALMGVGVQIVIDDFGTGYSNLANLRALPLDGLKLDASLTRGVNREWRSPQTVATSANDDEFLTAVISLGHKLGLTVTAEGIEGQDHADRLRAAGCDYGQGWHFGKAVPANEISDRLVDKT